ncbi:MAG: bile acid:sodium symporter family protein [Candidatus Gygaella obscura]|nr:bile acid:sodium symporter family protein [Candidatus Gygaella obscura]
MINGFLNFYNRFFVVWVSLGGLTAYFFPNIFIALKSYMELFFALTMFGIGMVLKTQDFLNIFKSWWIVLIGVAAQFTIMLFLAFLISKLFSLLKDFTLGLILTGSAPGAMASNVLSYLAGADVAYSVSLTTVSSLLSPILTPAITLFLAKTLFKISFLSMFFSIIKMVVIPLFLGFLIKKIFAKKIEPLTKVFPAISTTFIVFICALVIALNRSYISKMDYWILLAVLSLNILGLGLGYLVAKSAKFDIFKRRALSIEIGM